MQFKILQKQNISFVYTIVL